MTIPDIEQPLDRLRWVGEGFLLLWRNVPETAVGRRLIDKDRTWYTIAFLWLLRDPSNGWGGWQVQCWLPCW